MKKLGGWISKMLGKDAKDLCWFDRKGLEKKKVLTLPPASPSQSALLESVSTKENITELDSHATNNNNKMKDSKKEYDNNGNNAIDTGNGDDGNGNSKTINDRNKNVKTEDKESEVINGRYN